MKYYIGVDGGGTKTQYALFDENKNMLSTVKTDGSNHENLEGAIPEAAGIIMGGINALLNENSLKLETVYIGGGTPTSLEAEHLKEITDALNAYFDMKSVKEFTVEAGRPDTITPEKLQVLKNAGVTRISINPQTFSDNVLEAIGRRHTAEDTLDKFRMARDMGFNNINMDFIGIIHHFLCFLCRAVFLTRLIHI